MIKRLFAVLVLLTLVATSSIGFAEENNKAAVKPQKKISINLASNLLTFYIDGKLVYEFPVALGTPATPTPAGKFKIIEKEVNPSWMDPKDKEQKVVPSGPMNPLGYRWMCFYGEYGIHGTNAPGSIGSYASNGCIRLYEEDVEQLFEKVEIGTPVELYYQRVVVEKDKNGIVSCSIYPDAYGVQPLDIEDVNKILYKEGLAAFISNDDIADKLYSYDGTPIYVGKVSPVEVNNKWISGKLIEQEGRIYLPALPLAGVLKLKLDWNRETEVLSTKYASVPGMSQKDVLFVDAENVAALFHLKGGFDDKKVYVLHSFEEDKK